jgi:Kelch motif
MNRIYYLLLIAVLASCEKEVLQEPVINNPTSSNLPPVPVGGPDRTITLPDTSYVILDGTRSYDPDGIRLTLTWTQISGPATVVFYDNYTRPGDAYALFSTSGNYLFQLTAEDDRFKASDTVLITVKWASDCNSIREIVPSQTASVGFSPWRIAYSATCAIGPDKLVFAGGILTEPFWPDDPPPTFSSSIHLYDIRSNTWGEWEMLRPKGGMGAVMVGNKLFLGGGMNNAGDPIDEVEIHDLVSRTAVRANLSLPRTNLSAATAGNKVVFAGGVTNGDLATDAVDIYDMSTNTWSTTKLSQPRRNMSVMVKGNNIYFVGGSSSYNAGFSNTIDIYDVATDSWSVQRLSRQGSHFQIALFGNKMVVFAGMTGQGSDPSPRVEFVDLSNWTSVLDCTLFTPFPDYGPNGENLNIEIIGDNIYFGNSEYIGVFESLSKAWKYARVQSYNGILFSYQEQLYSLRYNYGVGGMGQYEVIRIGL